VTAAEHRDETLTSNLLTVTIPDLPFSTPTPLRHAREVYEPQREAGMRSATTSCCAMGGCIPGCLPRRLLWPAPSRAPRMRSTPGRAGVTGAAGYPRRSPGWC